MGDHKVDTVNDKKNAVVNAANDYAEAAGLARPPEKLEADLLKAVGRLIGGKVQRAPL